MRKWEKAEDGRALGIRKWEKTEDGKMRRWEGRGQRTGFWCQVSD
jgi:hypothetical protein